MKFSFLYFHKSLKMLLYYFQFCFVLTGFNAIKIKKSDGDAVLTTRPKIYSVLDFTVISLVTIGCLIRRFAMFQVNDILAYFSLGLIYICINLLGLMAIISFAYKANLYVVVINKLDEFDNELKKLHIVVTNTVPFWLSMIYIIAAPLVLYVVHIANRSVEKKVLDIFAGLLPILIRSILLTCFIILLAFLLQRCYSINQFLEELDDALLEGNINDSMTCVRKPTRRFRSVSAEQNAADILAKIAELLDQLVKATESIKDIFSFIIFINIALYIALLSTAILSTLYSTVQLFTELSFLEYVILVVVYTGQTMAIYILCFLLETETRNIYVNLGQLNICYLTPKLALMKNTLLLQGLHSKVDMNIYGIMPLRPSTFLNQFSICQTIMMILLQYYKKTHNT